MSLSLSGINNVNLTGTGNENGFGINDWAGVGVLSATSGLLGLGVEDSSVTLTDSSVAANGLYLALNGLNTADLYEQSVGSPSPGADTFNVSGWTHLGDLSGDNIASVTASESADITLTNSSLTSGTMSMGLSGITSANLTVTAATGNPRLIIDASTFSGVTNLTAAGTVDAILYGGGGAGGTLTVTGSGNNILIGEAADTTLTDTGTSRNILIGGGAGGDTIVGSGNDLLVSGSTEYDSDSSVHQKALEAILAEWTSGDAYLRRITKISHGVGPDHRDAFNRHTIHTDSNINTLSERNVLSLLTDSNAEALAGPNVRLAIHDIPIQLTPNPLAPSFNWFIVSIRDHVTRKPNEVKTVI